VPQSEQHVVERFGRLKSVLGPGINFIVPFLDRVAHKVSILERQLPNASQDAITADNVLVQVETSVFYRILEPEKTVYRIRDVDGAIATTVAGIVRAEIGKMELDEVQSNRSTLIQTIKTSVEDAVDNWGIEVTRAEILDVNLDQATRDAMLQQLNAERERRAAVTRAEGQKRAVELNADGELYAARQAAEARRVGRRCGGLCHGRRRRSHRQGRPGGGAIQHRAGAGEGDRIGGAGAGVADGDRAGGCGRCLRQGVPDAERPVDAADVERMVGLGRRGHRPGGGEVLLPSFVLLGFAIGAGAVALLLLVGGPLAVWLGGSLPVLFLVFAVVSLIAWLALRKWLGVYDTQVKTFDHDINND
jgi:regulator of protease activity HflC (stomatin/prohibitin superfamily)